MKIEIYKVKSHDAQDLLIGAAKSSHCWIWIIAIWEFIILISVFSYMYAQFHNKKFKKYN